MNWPKYYLVQDIPPRGGGVLNKSLYGEVPPRGPPLYPFIYHFFTKKVPLLYTFFARKKKNFASLLNAKNALSCKKVPLPEKGTPSALLGGASRV